MSQQLLGRLQAGAICSTLGRSVEAKRGSDIRLGRVNGLVHSDADLDTVTATSALCIISREKKSYGYPVAIAISLTYASFTTAGLFQRFLPNSYRPEFHSPKVVSVHSQRYSDVFSAPHIRYISGFL
ncbi:hypothetical protein ARMGADRAFT_1161972 [Armillaria gallica]|uniref:Uncharacterized protein n=1 Tax=Armillaria gallica TaxID=47427 RepID=A0A2H3DXS9_ARMGA|nr:hypothetical protein ARMGADRAFT_1161972 [Armillaria gallica]